jgi:Leucine-rich repeat (LRR) protein
MTRQKTLSDAIHLQRARLNDTGIFDLSGDIKFERHDVLAQLGSQKALKKLILNNSPLTSLHTLPPQPSLKELIADGSKLETLAGIGRQNRLMVLSLIKTPVGANINFRLSALICVGPRLSSINGEPVTNIERRKAQSYPPIAKHLVSAGWIVQYPPPSKADFRYLATQWGIAAEEEDFIAPVPPHPDDISQSTLENQDDGEPRALPEKLGALLRPLGFAIRSGLDLSSDVYHAVSLICDAIAQIEKSQDALQ